ncbi:hypothetical protein StrepF001_11835 [Streptomyces sp. F001]|uniref:hypothetical protein n=1 Tax=Streptomyces sp. F001 TaxID=1510026 RepID=UPI00101E4A1A|nr:hypothetical protein [Streptomyces sp. F001]RZB19477.1 hypothetical protein StrepF001_11835 [Streptomyces sp. F001]
MTVSLPTVPADDGLTGVPAGLRDEVHRVFDAAQLVELVMCISMWNALSRFHRVMAFELDMPAPPHRWKPSSETSGQGGRSDGSPAGLTLCRTRKA